MTILLTGEMARNYHGNVIMIQEDWTCYIQSKDIPDNYYADLHTIREISFTIPHLEAYKDKWGRTQYTEILH